jgi:thioredoxin 1
MALEITDANLEEVLAQNKITVIDFWAEWCGPCRMMGPVIDELAMETDAAVGKLDISANGVATQKFMVTSIPTIIFFKDGEEVKRIKGVTSKVHLKAQIDELKK